MIKVSQLPSVLINNDSEFGYIIQDGESRQATLLFEDANGEVPYVDDKIAEVVSFLDEIAQVVVLSSESYITQEPVALDTPIQLTLGPVTGTPSDAAMVDAAGNITINQAGTYRITAGFQFGRVGGAATATIVSRGLINGAQAGNSVYTELDNSHDKIPVRISGNIPFSAGDVFTVEVMRDSLGNNAGGVFTFDPTLPDWAPSPSCFVEITRIERVTTASTSTPVW